MFINIAAQRGCTESPIRAAFQNKPLNLQMVPYSESALATTQMVTNGVLPSFVCKDAGCLELHIGACAYGKKHDRKKSLEIEKG